jgi:hypothetical protein
MNIFKRMSRAVKAVAKKVGKAPVIGVAINPVGYAADTTAKALLGKKVYKALTPSNIAPALDVLHTVQDLTPGDLKKLGSGDRAALKQLTGKAITAVAASQQFGDVAGKLAPALSGQANALTAAVGRFRGPNAAAVRAALERTRVAMAAKQAKAGNALLEQYNAKDPVKRAKARTEVQVLRQRSTRGDRGAAATLTLFHRRAAAVRAARKFRVDASGMVRG